MTGGLDDINNALGGLGNSLGNGLGNIAGNTGSTAGNTAGLGNSIGKGNIIGDVGRIRDDVTISKEDIKLMRDIAERNFLVNYRQITPNATINVNGDIKNEADANKLLDQIEDMLEEQIASSLLS